jgi:hypothetical protein
MLWVPLLPGLLLLAAGLAWVFGRGARPLSTSLHAPPQLLLLLLLLLQEILITAVLLLLLSCLFLLLLLLFL